MGVLLPSFRRRVQVEIAGRMQSSLETVAAVKNGTLLSVKEGHENGSRIDGSRYVVATVQIEEGRAIKVAGYGEAAIDAIRGLAEKGDNQEFNAILRPSFGSFFKFVELMPATEQTAA